MSNRIPTENSNQIKTTRLFKLLNPELFLKPNKAVMAIGTVAFVGVVGWLFKGEMELRKEIKYDPSRVRTDSNGLGERTLSYQERLESLKNQNNSQ
ncbi:hypothetical protein H4219_001002 [Mycoemilia scoparia]|uniref:Small integral membrane protein 8 n=1 Tax=Mycoemilia scoparia TaxID=417184 RepID=A0A9W8A7T9_9FUNG|nr:hypothetical protein H4219_001002 [Mycoemilia scoparia]